MLSGGTLVYLRCEDAKQRARVVEERDSKFEGA